MPSAFNSAFSPSSPFARAGHPTSTASSISSSESTRLVGRTEYDSMPPRSPISRTPLLASASNPGFTRLSGSSSISHEQLLASGASSAGRYGPTASLSPSVSGDGHKNAAGFSSPAGPSAFSIDDDDDDALHTFTAQDRKDLGSPFDITSWRGWANGLTLAALLSAIVVLFAGYPIIDYYKRRDVSSATSGYSLGGINASGQYPDIKGFPSLIDSDTPQDVRTHKGDDGQTWDLVFSDEFNQDGRTFFDGDDPYFQAIDFHYWATGDFEWYDPSAVTTKDGALQITIDQENIHDLNFKSGMVQSWNKLCFHRNAYVEVSVSLPGVAHVGGFWPGVWMMGNLGRPGYGATTEGLWPYTYDSCDVGILANQTYVNQTGPDATLTTGSNNGPLSYLPGMRLSSCTCSNETHPGPNHNTGRGAPEIDMIEAQIELDAFHGQVSQSFQVAPFDDFYQWDNTTAGTYTQYDKSITYFNTYLGGSYQQAVSSLTAIDNDTYYNQEEVTGETGGQFKMFGVEYLSNPDDREKAYVTWYSQGVKSWKIWGTSVAPNSKTEVGQRLIPEEPMALVFNLGLSNNFENVDFARLTFPNYLRIDYIRVYQNSDGSVGCDPESHPTADYISTYSEPYNNPNLTTWAQAGYSFPTNQLKDGCS